VEAVVTRVLNNGVEVLVAEPDDLPGLYARMQEQGLLERVVKGNESYEEFLAIHEQCGPLCLETADGMVAAFWWITPFHAQAVCLHACVFKPFRHLAFLFPALLDKLFRAGATDIFLCAEDKYPDLGCFFAKAGLKPITRIGKEITVWAASWASTIR
jgi:hypothetical protein